MPHFLSRTLARRLAVLPSFKDFLADVEHWTGLRAAFFGPLGEHLAGSDCRFSKVCGSVQDCVSGRLYCQRVRQNLLQEARDHSCSLGCDASLRETAWPLRIGPHLVGFLVVGGYRLSGSGSRSAHRARYLLGRSGVNIPEESLLEGYQSSPELSPAAEKSLHRWVGWGLSQLLQTQTATQGDQGVSRQPVPATLQRVLSMLQARFQDPLRLADAANVVGMSEGHLSRLFHQELGICFTEYLNELRLSHARELLSQTDRSIADIALESGFQSISQFNRRFKVSEGKSPRHYRFEHRPPLQSNVIHHS